MSENLRQILDDHELYKSVQRMSSYAAQTSPRPISPRSYVGSNTGTTLVAEHRLPRAHLNKSSSDLQIDFDNTNVEHEAHTSVTYSRPSHSKTSKKVTIWPLGGSAGHALHRLSTPELESHLKKMKHPQVVSICLDMASQLRSLEKLLCVQQQHSQPSSNSQSPRPLSALERISERSDEEVNQDGEINGQRTRCRFSVSGCPFQLPSMELHEDRECKYRPTRCPSLTCPVKSPFIKLLRHLEEEHDGNMKSRDRVCRNNSSHLVSSYVNVDKEPIFYKTAKMTWVANELMLEGKFHFFLECMRIPPDWHLWLYFLGDERDAEKFQVTITLFREEEYGRTSTNGDQGAFSAQRSYTGPVVSINRAKEEIAEYGLGFMVHDKQIRPLCGPINTQDEQLFGYEVTVYRK